jgi:hypothetical protein
MDSGSVGGTVGTMTYYVALAFRKAEDDDSIVACDPRGAQSKQSEWLRRWPLT